MLSNGAVVMRKAGVFGIGTLMGLKTGAILRFQMLTLDCKTHGDLVEQGVRLALRCSTPLPFNMILHGLSHKLMEMTPSSTVRDAAYDVMNHFEFSVGNTHGNEALIRVVLVHT